MGAPEVAACEDGREKAFDRDATPKPAAAASMVRLRLSKLLPPCTGVSVKSAQSSQRRQSGLPPLRMLEMKAPALAPPTTAPSSDSEQRASSTRAETFDAYKSA